MKLEVFNVEHGACALLTYDNGERIMIDCGHNASTGWRPGDHLRRLGVLSLRALFVTNFDEDHVSGFGNLIDNVHVVTIFRNATVRAATIKQLKSKDGMGPGIDRLVGVLSDWERNPAVGASSLGLPGNVVIRTFWNDYPTFDDENNLSMMVELEINGTSFVFTGDLETAGWQQLVRRADVRAALSRAQVYFASHHGRASGCCDEVFHHCKPRFIVISDKAKGFQTQETHSYYHARAEGGNVIGCEDKRFVLTTRSDGDINFEIMANGTYYVSTSWSSTKKTA